MSKIYRVKVTYDVLVVADDEPNATLVERGTTPVSGLHPRVNRQRITGR